MRPPHPSSRRSPSQPTTLRPASGATSRSRRPPGADGWRTRPRSIGGTPSRPAGDPTRSPLPWPRTASPRSSSSSCPSRFPSHGPAMPSALSTCTAPTRRASGCSPCRTDAWRSRRDTPRVTPPCGARRQSCSSPAGAGGPVPARRSSATRPSPRRGWRSWAGDGPEPGGSGGAVSDSWDPERYSRFKSERAAPFFDLLGLVRAVPNGSVADLGCGTGELTVAAHEHLGARRTLGVDSSAAMLDGAADQTTAGVTFANGDIAMVASAEPLDVVISNAALHWVEDHPAVLGRWTDALGQAGQLAVQVPANADHPAHVLARELAEEEPFRSALGGDPPLDPVLRVMRPEEYATILDGLGFAEQHVRLQVYGHRLASTSEVVEWVRGTSLTRFASRLPDELFGEYVDRYRSRLVETLGMQEPYFYPFKRILFWGAR